MKHFIVQSTYIAPADKRDAILAEHRAFLQIGYDQGMLLASGPQEPRVGGIIVARAESREIVERFFTGDPFHQQGIATYQFTEFLPVMHQPFLKEWVKA